MYVSEKGEEALSPLFYVSFLFRSHVLFSVYLSALFCSVSSLPWGFDCQRPREDFREVLEKGG